MDDEKYFSYILGKIYPSEKSVIANEIKKKIYISYKKDFEPINNMTSDNGWGCTIRSVQMLIANIIIFNLLGRNYDYSKNNIIENNTLYNKVIDMFNDNYLSSLSLHNIIKKSKNIKVGEWVGSNTVCYVISNLINSENIVNNLIVEKCSDRVIEYRDIVKKMEDKALLLLIPMRLGLSKIDSTVYDNIYFYIRNTYFMGMIGGVNNSCYYFLGIDNENNNLIYLDPHKVQNYNDNRQNAYHTSGYYYKSLSDVDPSISFAFYFENINNFIKFTDIINKINDDNKLFSINYSNNYTSYNETNLPNININELNNTFYKNNPNDEWEIL